jgi:hypothetical protein
MVFTNHESQNTNHASPLAILAVQLEELHGRRFLELDAEVAGDLAQGVIKVREVIDGHIANEGAANFVVSRAAVQPAKKEQQLKARGEANDDPVGIHKCTRKRLVVDREHSGIFSQQCCGPIALQRGHAETSAEFAVFVARLQPSCVSIRQFKTRRLKPALLALRDTRICSPLV